MDMPTAILDLLTSELKEASSDLPIPLAPSDLQQVRPLRRVPATPFSDDSIPTDMMYVVSVPKVISYAAFSIEGMEIVVGNLDKTDGWTTKSFLYPARRLIREDRVPGIVTLAKKETDEILRPRLMASPIHDSHLIQHVHEGIILERPCPVHGSHYYYTQELSSLIEMILGSNSDAKWYICEVETDPSDLPYRQPVKLDLDKDELDFLMPHLLPVGSITKRKPGEAVILISSRRVYFACPRPIQVATAADTDLHELRWYLGRRIDNLQHPVATAGEEVAKVLTKLLG